MKSKGKIVPVIIKQRHAKVVVSSRRYPRKKPVACICPGIASAGDSFPPRRLHEEVRAVWEACFVVHVVPLSPLLFSSFAAVNWKRGSVGT